MSEGEFYNIEKILDRRKINGKFEYKIKWEGYPMSQSTWEPMKNLESAKELVEEYDRLHPISGSQKKANLSIKKKITHSLTKKEKKKKKKMMIRINKIHPMEKSWKMLSKLMMKSQNQILMKMHMKKHILLMTF